MSILRFINDIPIHEYFHWFCVLQSKRKQSKILILLQSTSSCLTASLSVNMEKSGSADMLITATHRHREAFLTGMGTFTLCIYESVWVSARGFLAKVKGESA